jgi:hypothetical protein
MPHVHRLFSFGVLTIGMCVVTASMGQEDESNPAWAKQFDAARAQMKEIGKAIRENVKSFRGSEAQPRKKSGAEIEAFNAAIEKLHAQLDKRMDRQQESDGCQALRLVPAAPREHECDVVWADTREV